MSDTDVDLDGFVSLSAELTGFTAFRLTGTGMARDYLQATTDVVGADVVTRLLAAHASLPDDPSEREDALRASLLADELLGPVARNIIKMWYVGTWYQLPVEWRETYGHNERGATFVVSPTAYTEGLLWPAVGANPPGAKGPGYGTWSLPPTILNDEE
jgi:hypothetical protein